MSKLDNFKFIRPERKRNRPTSARAKKTVRVVFAKNKSSARVYILYIYIGKELADKMGIVVGDKVEVGYEQQNSKRLVLRKADIGYTAAENNGRNDPSLRIKLQSPLFHPDKNDYLLHEVDHEFIENKNLIFTL